MTGVPPEASLARRLAALAYEATLYAALILVAGFLTVPLVSVASAAPPELQIPDGPARVLTFALLFAAGAAYFAWSWTGGRRTLPMKTWRLRLVRVDGTVPESRTALVRYVAAWIGPALALLAYVVLRRWGLGAHAVWLLAFNFLWAFVDRDGRFLHDRVAGTRIIIS
ncbi:MAG: RDD family protein [Casimicrobiaceae bacterium]